MRDTLSKTFAAVLFFIVCTPGLDALAQDGSKAEGSKAETQALLQLLRGGGFNLYFRHAQTEWSQTDRILQYGDWTSCNPDQVRQLSEQGRSTARSVGEAMRALGVPVRRVIASPYCRARQTAELLDLAPVEVSTDIVNMRVAEYFGGRGQVRATARRLLAAVPEPSHNNVLVAHGNVAIAATTIYPDEAEALIFRPSGNAFEFVGRLTLQQWRTMGPYAK